MNYNTMRTLYEENQAGNFYDLLAGEYDQMMDWESRLERESPFFEKIFREYGIQSLLDIGCGTGRHCFHFETLGLETVMGADSSGKAVELARARAAASGSEIQFVQASFTDVVDTVSGRFDLVCSLGNSISHLLIYDDLERAFRNFGRLLSDRGVILLQCLNWDLRLANRQRFFPPSSHLTAKSEKLFFRFLDFHDELVTMNLVIFQQDGSSARKWANRIFSTTLRPWRREIIRMALEDSGFITEREYGGTDLSEYHPAKSSDYIFIARKAFSTP